MSARKLVYVLVNTPVGLPQYVVNIFMANPYITKMFEENKGDTLRKRDIERLGEFPPCGARFRLLPYELRENFFTERTEPCGPDLFDIITARYLNKGDKEKKPLA